MAKTYLQTKLSGNKGQITGFDNQGNPIAEDFSGGFSPRILYYSDSTGLNITATKGSKVITGTYNSSKTAYVMKIDEFGSWVVNGEGGSKTIAVSEVTDYAANTKPLALLTWAEIRAISDAGTAASTFSVGDIHPITLNGKLSDGLTMSGSEVLNVFIIGFDHNISAEGNGNAHTITFQGFKDASGKNLALVDSNYSNTKTSGQWFNINNSDSSTGGWKSSLMKTAIMPNIEAAMPSDLKAVLKTVNKFSGKGGGSDTAGVDTTTEKVFLLAEKEIFGTKTYAQSDETNKNVRYTYWTNHSSSTDRVFYRHNRIDSTCIWWERSPYYYGTAAFCYVSPGGSGSSTFASYS